MNVGRARDFIFFFALFLLAFRHWRVHGKNESAGGNSSAPRQFSARRLMCLRRMNAARNEHGNTTAIVSGGSGRVAGRLASARRATWLDRRPGDAGFGLDTAAASPG